MPDLRFEVLPPGQKNLWAALSSHAVALAEGGYYLAGGTALALQLGHRESVDFDFFSMKVSQSESTVAWVQQLPQWTLRDRDPDTVHGQAGDAKISFIGAYKYPLVGEPFVADGITLAPIADIALMKLLAITHRAVIRDYIDLAIILRERHSLPELLGMMDAKYGNPPDRMLVLRALATFEDLDPEMPLMLDTKLKGKWKDILRAEVKRVAGR